MLKCSRADTGVGPSSAEGSQGCRTNWANFPAAAGRRHIRGMLGWPWVRAKICWNSHTFRLVRNQALAATNPVSPTWLYKIAWRDAVFASARPCHHPISKKDIIPTPSQPMKS